MNKKQVIIDVVLGAAVLGLAVGLFFVAYPLHANDLEESSRPITKVDSAVVAEFPIAYVDIDELQSRYLFAIAATQKLQQMQADAEHKLYVKEHSLDNEAADFQRKYQNNGFLSEDRAQDAYSQLMQKSQNLSTEYQRLAATYADQIGAESAKLTKEMMDSIDSFLAVYNADGRYKLILSNVGAAKDNILYSADSVYNITNEVIDGLNERYETLK